MKSYSSKQTVFLLILRMAIGWYILYQGIIKYYNPEWSAEAYLQTSEWLFSGFFKALGSSEFWLSVVNFLNIYGQIAIGMGLILGLFTQTAVISGIIMLSMFYFAHPPLARLQTVSTELIINNLFIQVAALLVLALFPTGHIIGLDRLFFNKHKK